MKNSILLLAVLVGSGLGCGAQTVEELGVPTPSAFKHSPEQRDPFCPIGWQRPESAPLPTVVKGGVVVVTTESYIRPDAFAVSSISLDRIPLAVINGKPYGEGDSLAFQAGEKNIRLQVYAIRDGAVTLRYNDFKVNCPLRIWQKPPSASTPVSKPAH